MKPKEVIGQSMRTTKSARPGSVVYVPMDKSEFRSIIFSEKKKNKIKKIVIFFNFRLKMLKKANLTRIICRGKSRADCRCRIRSITYCGRDKNERGIRHDTQTWCDIEI